MVSGEERPKAEEEGTKCHSSTQYPGYALHKGIQGKQNGKTRWYVDLCLFRALLLTVKSDLTGNAGGVRGTECCVI